MLDVKKVGIKIASLRKNSGYSQEKLADILKVSPQAISKWENGHTLPDTSLLPVLAQIFGCTIDNIIMPAYIMDESVEENKISPIDQQAEKIAEYVITKLEKREKAEKKSSNSSDKEICGVDDQTVIESISKAHGKIGEFPSQGYYSVTREKITKNTGKICTYMTVSASNAGFPLREFRLIENVYHRHDVEFHRYAFLNNYISQLPQIYNIDFEKKSLLMDNIKDRYIEGYNFNENNEYGEIIRKNFRTMIEASAKFHLTFWENEDAFGQIGLPWRLETPENLAAHISSMERGAKKYRKDELSGKILKSGIGDNNITEKQLDYFDEAIRYMKKNYNSLVESRFHTGKNITIIHGDMHPGTMSVSKDSNSDKKVVFSGLQAVRMGLGTEDLAMFLALHVASDKKSAKPLLDYYYECLSATEKAKDYSYENFMSDYRLAICENMFFTIKLIQEGIHDFKMRDRSIKAFEDFVLEI